MGKPCGVLMTASKELFTEPDDVPRTVDAYVAGFPDEIQEILQKIRATVREAAPDAVETISYQIPTFKLWGKPLIYFAAFKTHIGLYPTPTGAEAFGEELAAYTSGKGTAKFPLVKPIPFDLISKIVAFRVEEALAQKGRGKA